MTGRHSPEDKSRSRTPYGRILLHVGVQKTGSTYLQVRLRRHLTELRAQGVYVPVQRSVERIMGNAKLLATVLNGVPSRPFRHVFPHLDVGALDAGEVVADLLGDWHPSREDAILSAEIFRPQHAIRLRSLLASFPDVAVVLFVRRQDRWIESYYRQLVKTGEAHGTLSDFITAVLSRDHEALCYPDWREHYEAWQAAFGHCNVVFFEDVKSNLFRALFEAAGLPVPHDIPDVEPQQVALDVHQIAYLASLDPSLSFGEFALVREAAREASRTLGAPLPRSFLLPEDTERLRVRFAASNRGLLELLGRDTPSLELADASPRAASTTFEEVYASQEYRSYRELANMLRTQREPLTQS